MTVCAAHARSEAELVEAVTFVYSRDEDGDEDVSQSAFSAAYRTGWYDDDFAQVGWGTNLRSAVRGLADSWLTLDEQITPRMPVEGEWNAVYVISAGAGDAWGREDARPPMPHKPVQLGAVTFGLIGTFPVIARS